MRLRSWGDERIAGRALLERISACWQHGVWVRRWEPGDIGGSGEKCVLGSESGKIFASSNTKC